MKENMAFLAVESIKRSMLGSGNSSFGAHTIKVPKVHTTSYLLIFLLHWYNVGQPSQVLDGFDEFDCQQLLYFLHYLFFYFGVKYSSRLSHWLSLGIYIERVYH